MQAVGWFALSGFFSLAVDKTTDEERDCSLVQLKQCSSQKFFIEWGGYV